MTLTKKQINKLKKNYREHLKKQELADKDYTLDSSLIDGKIEAYQEVFSILLKNE